MKIKWTNYLILLLISLPALLIRLDVYPPVWFDEGYKVNAAYTLSTQHVYGTQTSTGITPFDPLISSGPADITAIALSYQLFGIGVLQARLVIVLYSLFALFFLYKIAQYLYGDTVALFSCLIVLAVPPIQGTSFIMLGRQILGEIPALALILFGLWMWFYSWEKPKILFSIIAGLAIGLGLLSKNQVAIALLPAMGIMILASAIRRPRLFWFMSLPVFMILAVQFGWTMLGWSLTPESIRNENFLLLRESVQIHIFTQLYGSTLTTHSIATIIIMLFAGLSASLRLIFFKPLKDLNKTWAETLLILFIIFTTIWFSLFSLGWSRYAFFGLVFSWLLIGKLIWDALIFIIMKYLKVNDGIKKTVVITGLALLSIAVLITNVSPLVQVDGSNSAQLVADYIRENISDEDLIETWEWELGPLSGHMKIHHPHQVYLLKAIRQHFHEQIPFDLNYDLMNSDPQYLITGPFSDWTRIYETGLISDYFEEIITIGPYRVYKRTLYFGT